LLKVPHRPSDDDSVDPALESAAPAPWSAPSIAEVAEAAGADDLFLFRRIGPDRFAHVDGCGRGSGWAGIVEIGLGDEPRLRAALSANRMLRWESEAATHVFGPYYARSVVITPVSDDAFAVFGSQGSPIEQLSDSEFRELGEFAAESLLEASPAKRLADELEVVNAVRELLSSPASNLTEALNSTASCAVGALSCEAGVLYTKAPERIAIVDKGWSIPGADAAVLSAMRQIGTRATFPSCVQDANVTALPAPFSSADGVVSYYLLELKRPLVGVLLLMHTRVAPRGFTGLCQALGLRLVEAAETVINVGLTGEQLREQMDEAWRQARLDSLTGLANRLGWDEAIAEAEQRAEGPAAVIQLDCRGLKQTNDRFGHHTGDELLRALSELLRGCVREVDLVARVGGDEFAILLAGADESVCEEILNRIRTTLATHPTIAGSPLAAAIGSATADCCADIRAAQRRADVHLVQDKARA
jgi:diguanylate cyclase (GGDEF)-like protein